MIPISLLMLVVVKDDLIKDGLSEVGLVEDGMLGCGSWECVGWWSESAKGCWPGQS